MQKRKAENLKFDFFKRIKYNINGDFMKEKKNELRKKLLKVRADINKETKISVKEKITFLPEYKTAESVFCYVSKKGEAETDFLLEQILKDNKRLLVPRCIDKKGNMEAVEIKDLTCLKEGFYGIKEPETGKVVNKNEIDLCIVPGIAFDEDGYRLGYGGGYYDRFLSDAEMCVVGVCFEELKIENLPKEENDVKADLVIFV